MMNDAVALLAVSQLACIGALAYLYMQVQSLRTRDPRARRQPSSRVRHVEQAATNLRANGQAARHAYSAQAGGGAALPVAARLSELGIDIPALARRMRKSEEEVRLLLHRQGAGR